MRRCSALLSTVLAAGSLALSAPAADAVPLCYSVRAEGSAISPVGSGRVCAPWAYGVHCEYGHTWYDPYLHVYTEVCVPRPI